MPAISVEVDGTQLVSIATGDADVIDINISATQLGPNHATLCVHGGTYPDDQDPQFLIWLEDVGLRPNQEVRITFLESGLSSKKGQTIDELYPEEQGQAFDLSHTLEQAFDDLAIQPRLFQTLPYKITLPVRVVEGSTQPTEHGYAFYVSWSSHKPDRVRVSFHAYTVESMRTHGPCVYQVQDMLHTGQSVVFEVGT